MSNSIFSVLSRLDQSTDAALKRLFEILSIPSISTDPSYKEECQKAAEWCTRQLNEIGFDTKLYPTSGQPMVVGKYSPKSRSQAPHILFYGHYDVQPADPLELWTSPPFAPRLAEHPTHGKVIVARGASDDKGQFMTFLEACRAWLDAYGELPLKITILLEGEEESGSSSLGPFLDEHQGQLKADVALVCDTSQWDAKTPAITTILRGLAFTEVTLTGPNRDLHSGLYGGPTLNPIHALTQILGQLHDDKGRIQIPYFYDDIEAPTSEQLEQWKTLDFNEKEFLGSVGLETSTGEQPYSVLEQLWSRPTAEINGIYGGYTGPGSKTVIPSEASAKISFRLVAHQNPQHILKNFETFVKDRIPKGCKVSFKESRGSRAVRFDPTTPYMQAAAQALGDEFGKPALMMGCGASIPIVQSFQQKLGMETLLIGFALEDDCIHSPNEKYNLTSFQKGCRSWVRIIEKFANLTV